MTSTRPGWIGFGCMGRIVLISIEAMPTSRISPDPARAIPALFREFGPRTYALALRLTGSAAEVEDVVQETFMQAFRRWETFERRSDPGTWLYAIAARLAKWHFRGRIDCSTKRPAMRSFSDLSPIYDTGSIDLAIDRRNPADPLMRAEARDVVRDKILDLPPMYRVPLVMKDILEMPLESVRRRWG